MKKILLLVIAVLGITSLSACIIAPPYAYPYYGDSHRYYRHDGGWDRRW